MKTKIIESIAEWREFRRSPGLRGRTLGFVPTMGALHEGHLSLARASRGENELTLFSIFVNPTQFDDSTDLARYPRTLERDLALLSREEVDFALCPKYEELYPDGYRFRVSETELSRRLCGAHRPGHFDGVLTVVLKLLQAACADRAYFGEKDYQQFLLIKEMAEAFFLSTQIIGCPTIREADGLAMSSRNSRLTAEARQLAAEFPRLLRQPGPPERVAQSLREFGFEVDYIEDWRNRRFGAVRLGSVRLIDNVPLEVTL